MVKPGIEAIKISETTTIEKFALKFIHKKPMYKNGTTMDVFSTALNYWIRIPDVYITYDYS